MSSVIDLIYDAVTRPDGWPDALAGIARFLSARDVSVAAFNAKTGVHDDIHLPIDPHFEKQYLKHWADRNFLWNATLAIPIGQTFTFDSVIAKECFERTEFYNEWWHPQGLDIALGANLLIDGAISVVATVYRPASKGQFDKTELVRFRSLLPHLRRAMQMRLALASTELVQADLRAVLAVLGKPALIVDHNARLLYANTGAERLLSERTLSLSGASAILATRTSDTQELRVAIESALSHNSLGNRRVTIHRLLGRPLALQIIALHRAGSVFAYPTALILIDDPEISLSKMENNDLLRTAYGLTPTEVRLALALLKGYRLRDAAEMMNVTFDTARVHLAHIFSKTDVHSQAQLLQLLTRSGLGG